MSGNSHPVTQLVGYGVDRFLEDLPNRVEERHRVWLILHDPAAIPRGPDQASETPLGRRERINPNI